MDFANACRKIIPEGIVLLENDGALPLREGEHIALYFCTEITYYIDRLYLHIVGKRVFHSFERPRFGKMLVGCRALDYR